MTTQKATIPISTKKLPAPKKHWLWKNMKDFAPNPLAFIMKNVAELGDTFEAEIPSRKFIMTANADLIKYVLQGNHRNYRKTKSYDQMRLLLGNGLVTSRGDFWRKQRRLAQPAFNKKNLENLFQSMGAVVTDYMKELNNKRGQTIDIAHEMMAITAKIAIKSLFSADLDGDLLKVYDSMTDMQRYVVLRIHQPIFTPFYRFNGRHSRYEKSFEVMDGIIQNLIRERQESGESKDDLLQMLMDARYEDTGEKMEYEQLRDELLTIFSAGHETSANAMAWTWYLLVQHPEIVEKLKEEAQAILNGRLATFEDLKQLTYTRQVLEEGMRLYPPAWIVGREAIEADEWEGLEIEKDKNMQCCIYALHHNAAYYPDPEKFDPERFTPEKVKARPSHHYMPFGAGPRFCIGNHFAMMEMQLILAAMVQNFDFELIEGQKIVMEPLITLRPKYGIKLKVK
ncbi:MAG: cytochrome P450 [Chitinophagales bacterium]